MGSAHGRIGWGKASAVRFCEANRLRFELFNNEEEKGQFIQHVILIFGITSQMSLHFQVCIN